MKRERISKVSAEPVQLNDMFLCRGKLAVLAAGHPLRGNHCAGCGVMIGGQLAQIVALVVASGPMCGCGQIPVCCQLFCQWCAAGTDDQLTEQLVAYTERVHGGRAHS